MIINELSMKEYGSTKVRVDTRILYLCSFAFGLAGLVVGIFIGATI